jgi:hypothetical membrane protein
MSETATKSCSAEAPCEGRTITRSFPQSLGGFMNERVARISLSRALLVVGISGAVLGIGTVLFSTILYVQDHPFSLFETYLSDIGNTPRWPQVVFNSGMLIIAPVRYLFLVLLVFHLRHMGAGRTFCVSALVIGFLVAAGSIGIASIPYSLHKPLHKVSALLYFFGAVVLLTLIGVQELRRGLHALLPVSSLAVTTVYLVFAVLLSLVGRVEGIIRSTPVLWEWLAFCSLIFWLITHALILGDATRESS